MINVLEVCAGSTATLPGDAHATSMFIRFFGLCQRFHHPVARPLWVLLLAHYDSRMDRRSSQCLSEKD